MTAIITYFKTLKQEVNKISWPKRNELLSSTAMVLVTVMLASMFFIAIDYIAHNLIQSLLMIGN